MNSSRKSTRRIDTEHLDIPKKANRVLQAILIALVAIAVRLWYFAVIEHEAKLEEARRPQRKVIMEPAKRATIRDRFNIPLAINKLQYQATIIYSQIREIPYVEWQRENGKRVKLYKRKEYISKLATLIGNTLDLSSHRIEDLIYAKGIFYGTIPFVIKENISEKEYYRLKILEKDWPGIYVRKIPQRYYPLGRVAAEVVGYMGAINRKEYESIIHEIKALNEFLDGNEDGESREIPKGLKTVEEVRKRLKDLEERAYTINDYIGKTGIEGKFEEELRGFQGKKIFLSNAKGHPLRELPGGRNSFSGMRYILTISAELQEYAELLLARNEKIREVRVSTIDEHKQNFIANKHPWVKGGAIVAMDPNNGEIMALATFPRFDPNDFVSPDKSNISRWFETETYLQEIWDGKKPLEREVYGEKTNTIEEEAVMLDWDHYLRLILNEDQAIFQVLQKYNTIKDAVIVQNSLDQLSLLTEKKEAKELIKVLYEPTENEEIIEIQRTVYPYFHTLADSYDKILLVDLYRIAIAPHFSKNILEKVQKQNLNAYHQINNAFLAILKETKEQTKKLFREYTFNEWRKTEEKAFLKQKRASEILHKQYAKPYIDYIDQQENAMFKQFWQENKNILLMALLKGKPLAADEELSLYIEHFLAENEKTRDSSNAFHIACCKVQKAISELDPDESIEYLNSFRSYNEMQRPLLGNYKGLRKEKNVALEKHLAGAFYAPYGYGNARSHAFRQSTIQGSIFKVIIAYLALIEKYKNLGKNQPPLHELNPLTIDDQVFRQGKNWYVGYHEDGRPIPQNYKGGRLPRSCKRHIGKIDIVKALETSSNPYFSLLAAEALENPNSIIDACKTFSLGNKTGIDLPFEISGKNPINLKDNPTELYSIAIGQGSGSLIVTPLQTACMLTAIANGGKMLKPKIVKKKVGKIPSREQEIDSVQKEFPYKESLEYVGIDFPLFLSSKPNRGKTVIYQEKPVIMREVFLPIAVRKILLEGMRRAVLRIQEESLTSLNKLYEKDPDAIKKTLALRNDLVGKTSTAEVIETLDLDRERGRGIFTHVGFGGISFNRSQDNMERILLYDEFGKPELVIVVYLRYGGFGKEAAPLAAQMIAKWREIKEKYKEK